MVRKTLKRTVLGLFVLGLACGTLWAQSQPVSIHVTPSTDITPTEASADAAAALTLFSNLGPSPTDNFFAANGWVVTGPANTGGFMEQWVAGVFQAKKASHVTMVQLAVSWIAGATKEVDVALYNDDGTGQVGTILSPVVVVKNLPTFGTCCTLATARFSHSVAINASTNYWVVVSSDASATDFEGAWGFSNLGLNSFNVALGGWTGNTGAGGGSGAMAVKGTTP